MLNISSDIESLKVSEMKKVLIITNIPSPYRVDLFYYMQTHIIEYEFHILYCAKNESNRWWNSKEEKMLNSYFVNSKVITLKKKYDTRYIYIPKDILKQISNINPDIIIGWEYSPTSIIALIWCKLHKCKYISLTDGTLYSERNIKWFQKLNRKIVTSYCNAAIASSSKAKEKLLSWGMNSEEIFVSLLTVDIEKICKVQHKPKAGRLLYVGSMIERKGLDLLIAALKHVKVDFCLHIVGNGSTEEIEKIKNLARKANVLDSIKICGFKQGEELIKEYQEAQVFVLPTREDCFGLVLLEAFCMGVPIISSKYADGAYDIIQENKNGIIIDPFDEITFGEKINDMLSGVCITSQKRNSFIEKFSFKNVSEGYVKALKYVENKS